MAVKIRLARYGAKKKPFYRVVASDSRFPRDGRFLEVLGTYDPRNKQRGINVRTEDVDKWIAKGAEISDTVRRIVKEAKKKATAQN
ncbi:MAG: 30S ribosomal protein S16 [Desulfomonile tiedjei]|nr:30S ribosomal protein S16 [Desulfomonile tiedjei]